MDTDRYIWTTVPKKVSQQRPFSAKVTHDAGFVLLEEEEKLHLVMFTINGKDSKLQLSWDVFRQLLTLIRLGNCSFILTSHVSPFIIGIQSIFYLDRLHQVAVTHQVNLFYKLSQKTSISEPWQCLNDRPGVHSNKQRSVLSQCQGS